jgi:hypothetical protein
MSEQTTTDRLVGYAKAMGFKPHQNCSAWFRDSQARLRLLPSNTEAVDGIAFNPIVNLADAIELAKAVGVRGFSLTWNPEHNKDEQPYQCVLLGYFKPTPRFCRYQGGGSTDCAAICAAVDAALEAKP